MIGKVIWFNDQKGYGFISYSDSENDLFVHFSDILVKNFKSLKKNQSVKFTIGTNYFGKPKATEVTVIE